MTPVERAESIIKTEATLFEVATRTGDPDNIRDARLCLADAIVRHIQAAVREAEATPGHDEWTEPA
jgi:hypothetical protein